MLRPFLRLEARALNKKFGESVMFGCLSGVSLSRRQIEGSYSLVGMFMSTFDPLDYAQCDLRIDWMRGSRTNTN